MPWWQKLIAKLEIGELKSLGIVEQVMRAEERAKEKPKFTTDRRSIDNTILVIVVVFFALLALRFYR